MTKTEDNLFKLCGFDSQILEIINQFKKSDFREYYWTEDELYSYSKMSLEERKYIQGVLSFLIEKTNLFRLKKELLAFSNLSVIQTINGFHLYDELKYEPNEYYWGILQKLYKTEYIQVSLFPTSDIKTLLKLHEFKFYGGSVNNEECYSIIDNWKKEYNVSIKCIAIGQSVDLWIDKIPDLNSNFYDDCFKICNGFIQNGEKWKDLLAKEIEKEGSFTLYDK